MSNDNIKNPPKVQFHRPWVKSEPESESDSGVSVNSSLSSSFYSLSQYDLKTEQSPAVKIQEQQPDFPSYPFPSAESDSPKCEERLSSDNLSSKDNVKSSKRTPRCAKCLNHDMDVPLKGKLSSSSYDFLIVYSIILECQSIIMCKIIRRVVTLIEWSD